MVSSHFKQYFATVGQVSSKFNVVFVNCVQKMLIFGILTTGLSLEVRTGAYARLSAHLSTPRHAISAYLPKVPGFII